MRMSSPRKRTQQAQFHRDAKTLWINGPEGLLARFGMLGIDIHKDNGCAGGYCTHRLTTREDWELFKVKVAEIHGIIVGDRHMPERLRKVIRIAFDIKLMRPGCVLLQVALGCRSRIAHKFPVESWLIAPTPDLRVYEITDEQLSRLIARVENQRGGR